jgi:hypothetical protein
MAHIAGVAPTNLITSVWGNSVAVELNTRCIKVNGEIGEGAAGVANQWMTGTLVINAAPALKLRRTGDQPYIQFESTTGATPFATITALSTQVNYNAAPAASAHRFLVNGVEKFKVDTTGAVLGAFTATGKGTLGGNGELLRLVDTSTALSDFHDCYIGYYGAGTSLASPGVMTGWVGYSGTSTLQLRNEVLDGDALVQVAGAGTITLNSTAGGVDIKATTGAVDVTTTTGNINLIASGATGGAITLDTSPVGDINLSAGDVINITSGGVYQGMIDGPAFLWGKAAPDIANAGIELLGTGYAGGLEGQIRSTLGASGAALQENLRLNRIGSAQTATGADYITFQKEGITTARIEVRATTGVVFDECVVSAPSDYRLKDDLGPVADGLDTIMLLRPRHVRWKANAEPDDVFIAHELAAVLPGLVKGEKDGVTETGEMKVQTIREAGLLPIIVSAMQELAVRVEALED